MFHPFRFIFIPALLAFHVACHATDTAAQGLTLEAAVRAALADAPSVDAQRAAVAAARENQTFAGELPDPRLLVGVTDLPINTADRFSFTRDSDTQRMIGIEQMFPGADKQRLRREVAGSEWRKEQAMLTAAQQNVQHSTAVAWVDRYFAERQRDLLIELKRETALQTVSADATLAGGKGQAADPIASRLAEAQLADRIIEAERVVSQTEVALARWIGDKAKQPLGAPPDFAATAPFLHDFPHNLDLHPNLAVLKESEAVASANVKLAQAASNPDWNLEVSYGHRGPAYSNMLTVVARIDLPILQSRRQDPAIAAKLSAAEQSRAQTEDARRALLADIRGHRIDWQAARTRMQRFERELLPLARERVQLALASYGSAKSSIDAVLEARRAEIEIRLNYLAAQAEFAKSWAHLHFQFADSRSQP